MSDLWSCIRLKFVHYNLGKYDVQDMRPLARDIAPGDGMYDSSNVQHYFAVGESALDNIKEALRLIGKESSVASVLDYACGYGRVLRWLYAYFPNVLGVDADKKAVEAAHKAVGARTKVQDISLATPIGETFDLIWVGSLFTHLPRDEVGRCLTYLSSHLNKDGCLVFTTHGDLVAKRLALKERAYGLGELGIASLSSDYQKTGYGFASYPKLTGYGISCTTTLNCMDLIRDNGLTPIMFKAAGWAKHQDIYAVTRN
jgi:SAM-dependent methyltransferase